jgi:hypothetical protein
MKRLKLFQGLGLSVLVSLAVLRAWMKHGLFAGNDAFVGFC